MQHLIENIAYLQDKYLIKGFIFGFIHIAIMLLGFYTGWSINRFLKLISNGLIAGIIVVISVIQLDKLKIDDPVGAISVHLICGIWGTLAVGIFSSKSVLTQAVGVLGYGAFCLIS